MTKDQPRVLVVEDEPALAEGLAEALGFQGYDVDVAEDGERGLDLAMRRGYDVMLLDVMLPRLDGFEVLRRLRAAGRTVPTILLTAKGAEEDRVRGLETGADDYVTKPFALRELVARVAAQIRRTRRERHEGDVFEADGMRFDLGRLVVLKDGEEIVLTPREGEIIAYLRSKQGNVVTREAFLLDVWRYPTATVETRTVDNTLAALRRKVEGSAEPRLILTVRGKGYRWGGG